jgi:hypothetical protein
MAKTGSVGIADLDPTAKEAYGYVSGRVGMLLEEHGQLPLLDAGMHVTFGRVAVCGFGFELSPESPLRKAGTTMYLENAISGRDLANVPGVYIGDPGEWGDFAAQNAVYLNGDTAFTASEGAFEWQPNEALGLVQQELRVNDCQPTMGVVLAIVRPQ